LHRGACARGEDGGNDRLDGVSQFTDLAGVISKMRASPKAGGCRHQRNSASNTYSDANPFFFVKGKKILF